MRAALRRRTKSRGRETDKFEVAGDFPSAPSYESVKLTRIKCLTLNNGPCEVARR